jgi:hypothetical protein
MDFPLIHAYRERLEEVGVNPRDRVVSIPPKIEYLADPAGL